MEGELESLSLKWTVFVPARPPWPNSKSFGLGNEEFYLTCSENRSRSRRIFLNLMCLDDSPFASCSSPLYCTISLKNFNIGTLLFTQSIRVDDIAKEWMSRLKSYRVNIWQQQTQDIEQVDSDFRTHRGLSFTLTWTTRPLLDISPISFHMPPTTAQNSSLDPSSGSSLTSLPTEKCSAKDVSVQTLTCTNQSLDVESLLKDFSKLLDGDSNPDVELHCEGHITKAHKAILSVRSPVLETMLQTDMVEGRTGVVKIQDMAADTFHSFVRYLYTGKLDALTFDSAISLYEAGDMYRVESLARRCSQYLRDNLTVENSCHILVLADAHSDSSFVDAVIAYMVGEKVPMSGANWKAFCDTHSKLANQVYSRMCENFSI